MQSLQTLFSSLKVLNLLPAIFGLTKIAQSRPQLFFGHQFNNLQRAALLRSLIQYDGASFQIWWTAAGLGELCVWFPPIRNGETFWMNNNLNYYLWWTASSPYFGEKWEAGRILTTQRDLEDTRHTGNTEDKVWIFMLPACPSSLTRRVFFTWTTKILKLLQTSSSENNLTLYPQRGPMATARWLRLTRLNQHYLGNRELKQPRRRRQQKPHKFAYLTMENSIFARFVRAYFIVWHFEDVLVLSTTWNDLFCSCVDDDSIWWQMFNFVFLYPKRLFQFNSRTVRTHFSSITTLNN